MVKYITRRLLQAIPILLGVCILTFLIIEASPGGFARTATFDPKLTQAQREKIAARYGVGDPLPVKFLTWLVGDFWRQYDDDDDGVTDRWGTRKGVLFLEFGYSYSENRLVTELFGERLGATLELGVSALLFGLLLGVPVGIIAAVTRGSWFDNLTRVLAVVVNAVPVFWMGLMLILIFGAQLNILPMGDRCPISTAACPPLTQRLEHLILPTIVLGAGGLAGYSRFLRASMLDVIGQDYMRTARAKGLRQRTVWFLHGARNALIPLATFLGPAIAFIWTGAFITEQIFAWPGIGYMTLQYIRAEDFPVVMLVTLFAGISTIVGYIISDILYAVIDPRIRFN